VRNEPWGRKVRPITDITSTALGKKKWQYADRLFGTNSLKEGAMWQVDPLLGNCHERSSYTTPITE
jgi:hypothetical protein